MSEVNDIIKALAEFNQKQEQLTTGILVLINDQIHHFETKKEWDSQKESLLAQTRRCFKLVDCEKWQQIKDKHNIYGNSN